MKRSVKELQMQYQIAMDDEGILLAAEEILLARLIRQGKITDPMDCTRFLGLVTRFCIPRRQLTLPYELRNRDVACHRRWRTWHRDCLGPG